MFCFVKGKIFFVVQIVCCADCLLCRLFVVQIVCCGKEKKVYLFFFYAKQRKKFVCLFVFVLFAC